MQASAREVKIVDYVNFKKVKHGRRASVQEGRAAAMAIALHIRLEAAEREKAEEEARQERKKAEDDARQERRRQKRARRRHRHEALNDLPSVAPAPDMPSPTMRRSRFRVLSLLGPSDTESGEDVSVGDENAASLPEAEPLAEAETLDASPVRTLKSRAPTDRAANLARAERYMAEREARKRAASERRRADHEAAAAAAAARPLRARGAFGSLVSSVMRSGRAGRAARRSAAARAIQTAARLYLARLAQHDAARVLVSLFRRNHGWVLREKWRALVDLERADRARREVFEERQQYRSAVRAKQELESVRRVAKSAGWEPPQKAPKLSRRERAIAVLLFKTGGFPKDAEGWSRWYSELRLRDGDARGERDCSAVRRQAKALAQARKLADVEALAVLDKPTLLRFGFESHAQLGVSACASARADGKGSGSPAVRFQADS